MEGGGGGGSGGGGGGGDDDDDDMKIVYKFYGRARDPALAWWDRREKRKP